MRWAILLEGRAAGQGQVTHREQARHGRARFLQHKARARAPDAGNRLAGVRLVQQLLAALRYLLSLLRVNCTECVLVMIMHSDSQVAGSCCTDDQSAASAAALGSAALTAQPRPSRLHRTSFQQGLFERYSQAHMRSNAVLMLKC